MKKALVLPRPIYEEMMAHLEAAYPLEACGMLAGERGAITRLYPIENILRSPVAYEMEPRQQLEAMLDMEDRGREFVAIFHSHPRGPEVPSATDVAKAYYPDAVQIIVSFRSRRRPSVRAFTIIGGQVDEVALEIQ